MTKKENLLDYLKQSPNWHTAKELAVEIGVSVRTVKNYINQLRHENLDIISGNQGYKLNIMDKSSPSRSKRTPVTAKERTNFIINYLINEKSEVNIYDLADILYVSESRILQDMQDVQRKVGRFGVSLTKKGDTWKLTASEREKRSLLSALIYDETTGSFLNQSIIQLNFKNINVDKIKQTIVDVCTEHNVYLNTFDLNNVVLHLVIIIERVNQGNLIQVETKNRRLSDVSDSTAQIIFEVEDKLNLKFEEADTNELILILDTAINGIHKNASYSSEASLLVQDIIQYVKKVYDIDLDTDSFKERFTLHLDRLIERSRAKEVSHNPIAANIKVSSPTIYECAVLIAHRISTKAKITLEDNEIAYIALHVGNAIAEQMEENKKISVVILMPEYYDNAAVISNKLQDTFDSSINITKIITDPSQINALTERVDLVVAINTDYVISNINTVHLSQFMLPDDIKKMTIAVATRQHQLKKDKFQEKLLQFFTPSNFVKTKTISDIYQAFNLISDKLVEEDVVTPQFKQKLYQREDMSSTAFGRVAIPHSFEMSANKSRGFIIINPKGIKWSNGNKVYLVIGLAIDPKNSQLFRDVFDELSNIVTDVNNVTQLIKSKNYQEFIIKLVDLL